MEADVKVWSDLAADDRKEALANDRAFELLQATYPDADFSERDRLLEKYAVVLKCSYCNATVKANFLTGLPDVCPECKRRSLEAPTAPGAVAEWLLKHYHFATTEDKDQNLYAYDENTGAWSDEKADAIIKRELGIVYGDNLTTQKLNNVRLSLQAKTFIPRDKLAAAIKLEGEDIAINLKNGVLFVRKGKLGPHDPRYYFMGQINVSYDENAAIPEKFIEFIMEISQPNDENTINLMEAFAYPLLPGYPIQRAIALIGAGQNGKSTFLKAMEMFYGERYMAHLTMQQLSGAIEGQPFALTQLVGKLANIADDLPAKAVKDVGYFKQLTGGSSVEAERKFGNRLSFVNTAKFFFAANQMPAVSEDTVAFYRRFLFVEFSNIIEKPRDQKEVLAEIMSEKEKSGVLNMLLGIVVPRLLAQNDFTCAKTVDEVSEQYQRHSNTAQLFFDKMLQYNPEAAIQKERLWQIYQEFCEGQGILEVSQKLFWRSFSEEFPQVLEQKSQENGIRKKVLKGIKVVESIDDPVEQEPKAAITIKDYLSVRDVRDVRDFPLYLNNITLSKYFKEVSKKAGHPGHGGQNNTLTTPNSNNLLEIEPKIADSDKFQNNGTILNPNANGNPQELDQLSTSPLAPAAQDSAQGSLKTDDLYVNDITTQGHTQATPNQPKSLQEAAKIIVDTLKQAPEGAILGTETGDWHLFSKIMEQSYNMDKDTIDMAMKRLIEAGDIYEIRPGVFKLTFIDGESDE